MNFIVKSTGSEPITLAQAKKFLGEAGDHYNSLIDDLIVAARERAEMYMNRSVVEKTITAMFDSFPGLEVKLPRGPVKEVDDIKRKSNEGTLEVISTDLYDVDIVSEPARVVFKEAITLPEGINNLHITYTAGYGDVTIAGDTVPNPIPQTIINAMLMMVRTMYDHRDDIQVGTIVAQIPQTAKYLLNPYRIHEFR